MNAFHRHIRRYCATLLGIVFLISGILKLWDPTGTGLIVVEYGKFFGAALSLDLSKWLGAILAFTECTVGIGLITGVLRKACAIVASAMLVVFTIITLILWIFNPPMDCGCFGEAIHLTHAQSFLKNVVLLSLALIAFIPFKDFGLSRGHRRVAAILSMAVLILVAVRSQMHLQVVDFTDYNWGARLLDSLDESAGEDDYRHAPVFSFTDGYGEYQDNMASLGQVVLFTVYDLKSAPWENIVSQYRQTEATGALPLVVIASYAEDPALEALPADLPLYFADYKTLITINRSNGGGTYFYDGELIHKWASADFPEDISATISEDPVALSSRVVTRRRIFAQSFCVILAAILLLV